MAIKVSPECVGKKVYYRDLSTVPETKRVGFIDRYDVDGQYVNVRVHFENWPILWGRRAGRQRSAWYSYNELHGHNDDH